MTIPILTDEEREMMNFIFGDGHNLTARNRVKIADDKEASILPPRSGNKYQRQIKGVYIDVYDVLKAWDVGNPALQHLIKKALQAGDRGHKDRQTDLQDIIDSAIRAKELG